MMPRPPSNVLRRLGGSALAVAVIFLAMLFPARHVLVPLWPDPVDEVLTQARPGHIERRFHPAGAAVEPSRAVVARSRPVSLWRLETAERVVHAWLAGVRDAQGRLMKGPPPWLKAARVDGPMPEEVRLVMTTATRESLEIDAASVSRMYRPNDLTLAARAALWRDRLRERWRGFKGEARMTPLGR